MSKQLLRCSTLMTLLFSTRNALKFRLKQHEGYVKYMNIKCFSGRSMVRFVTTVSIFIGENYSKISFCLIFNICNTSFFPKFNKTLSNLFICSTSYKNLFSGLLPIFSSCTKNSFLSFSSFNTFEVLTYKLLYLLSHIRSNILL